MRRWVTAPRIIVLSLAVLLAAAWFVPQLSAERYREPIRSGLEAALGRKVKIGELKFRLLPVPGFSISDVEIGEDPALGHEPIAYVHTLSGRPRLSALFGGPLEFASVDLEETSVNLTRADLKPVDSNQPESSALRWNFTSLLRPKLLAAFPSVHMTGGRVNFKFGETKSVFYLLNTDVDLWPPSRSDAPWTIRIVAEPARTDRPAHGFGRFTTRGEWEAEKGLVTLDVKLEKSELGDVVTLFRGRESYLHGHIWGDAHLAGPVNRVGIAGTLRIDDIHGWNQTPPGGSAWPVYVGGAIDVPGQTIDIRATTQFNPSTQSPLDLRYRVTNYLARPRWGVTAIFSQLPLSPFADIARNMGLAVPEGLTLAGAADGAVGFSMPEGKPQLDGQVRIGASTLAFPGAAPLHIAAADLNFAGAQITLNPATLSNEAGETASITGGLDMSSNRLDATLSTDGMSVASLHPQMAAAKLPMLSLATSGVWSGDLQFSNVPEPGWTGDIHLKDADLAFDAFSSPLHLAAADATVARGSITTKRLSFSVLGWEGAGDYRYEAGATRPHRFRVNLAHGDAAALEKLLAPALRRGNFLSATLGIGKNEQPEWLRFMHADGSVQISSLNLGGSQFTKLKSRILWDGDEIRLAGLQGSIPLAGQEAALNGSATISLADRQPHYDFSGTLSGYPWRSGKIDADGTLSTSGSGVELLSRLKAEGKFRGRGLEVAADEVWDRVEGAFDCKWNARAPQLKLDQLVVTKEGDTFQGNADTRADGQLVVRVTDGSRQIQASGALLKGEALKVAP